jgi:uncharacterized membrane protein
VLKNVITFLLFGLALAAVITLMERVRQRWGADMVTKIGLILFCIFMVYGCSVRKDSGIYFEDYHQDWRDSKFP